jgi:Bacterial protein of unknown function (DUF937)
MRAKVIDEVQGTVTPEVIDKVATSTGESPENVTKAIHGAFPTVLAGLSHHASTPDGASSLLKTLQENNFAGAARTITSGGDLRDVTQHGQSLVGKIFGDGAASVSRALSTHSGVKISSAALILSLAAPIVAGALAPEAISGTVAGLAGVLASYAKALFDHPSTPPGLAGALGWNPGSSGGGAGSAVDSGVARGNGATGHPVAAIEERERGAANHLRWGLVAALGAAALASFGAVVVMRFRPARSMRIATSWTFRSGQGGRWLSRRCRAARR